MEEYDVFLSFRGIDTRKGFTSHIHRALEREKYRVFIDDEGLERGSSIKKSLLEAIKNSHSSIPIISENYASSTACLRELAQIVECKKTRGQTVIPVFYHVDPSLLKKLQIPSYKKEFEKYCSDPNYKPEEVQSWKDALAEVCRLAGWTIYGRDNEGQMIKKIVADIQKRVAGKEVNDQLLKTLRAKLPSANSLMDDAEAKQFQNPNVREWLAELKATIYDADDLMDEIDAEALRCTIESESGRCFKKARTDFSTAFNKRDVESKTKEILDRLEDNLKQKDYFGLKGDVSENPLTRTPETSLVDESGVYGRDDDKEAILKLLLSDEVGNKQLSMIPIEGMGGIGKTTLAQLIYNDDRVKNHFKIKAWVCVSENFDILKITKEILESISDVTCDNSTNLNRVQEKLKQAVDGKKFLIILDDVWNEKYLEWDKLKSPLLGGACGSTIIVTTRSGDIANMVRTVPSYKLGVMSEVDCWSLFAKHAALKPGAHPELEVISRQIVKKCKGLPLAVKALGSLLRVERNPQEWQNILTSDLWDESLQKKHGILPSLWLSYYYLPPHLKRCFAYCSIFPKDYEFEKENLIFYWMGENLLKPQKNKSIEEVGEEYFNDLLSRSLFQRAGDDRFTMHDLINDLAKYASCKSCLRLDDEDLKDAGKVTRRVSCMRKWYLDIKNLKDFRKENLRTLLLTSEIDGRDIENHLAHTLESMRCLRVLEVRAYADEGVCGIKVFKSIANLKLLRYLRFDCFNVEELHDSFCTLYNLQTLILRDCGLTKLPDSIGKLKQLRHLDLSESSITEIPDSICNLESLRYLDLSYNEIEELPDTICNLESLRYLDLSYNEIEELPDTICNLESLKMEGYGSQRLANSITMLTNLRHLILGDDFDDDFDDDPDHGRWMLMPTQMSKLENLQTMPPIKLGKDTGGNIKELGKLQHLQGKVCIGGLEYIGNAEDASKANLKDKKGITTLRLEWTNNIDDSEVARAVLDRLQPHKNLRELEIDNYGGTSFPCWFGYESFSYIKEVKLYNCKNCTKLPALGLLPSLEYLKICGFDKLERIGNEFYYSSDASSSVITKPPFKSLKYLEFWFMAEWKEWSVVELVEGSGGAFSNLEKLKLSNCPKLKWACLPEYLPSLRDLEILKCKNIKAFPAEGRRLPSNIQSITIWRGDDLESLSEEGWPSNLTSLVISECDTLFAGKQWNLGMLSSLTSLEIQHIKVVETFPEKERQLPTSLTSLTLWDMPNLKSLNGKAFQRLTSLQHLSIKDCKQLQCLGEETLPSSISQLWISDCPLLKPRCHIETGEEWPKIRHIPRIYI